MTIHIINNLSYDKITIEIDNNSYTIQKSESINISSDKSQNQLSVTVLDKSNHYFDLPALLTLSFGRKSSWCEVFCTSILKLIFCQVRIWILFRQPDLHKFLQNNLWDYLFLNV